MTIWYTARGAGLSALILLTLSVSLGALVSDRGRPGTRVVVQYLHRAAGALGITVLALHITMILLDAYAKVGVVGAAVPFTAHYRPTFVGLGSLAAYTFVAVALLGLARGRLATSPRAARVWRSVHALAYVGWGSAMLHGMKSGTDTSVGWVRLLYIACAAAVFGSIALRLATLTRPGNLVRRPPVAPAVTPARVAVSR